MNKLIRPILLDVIACCLTGAATGQDQDKLPPAKQYVWQDEGKANGLTDQDLQLLKQNKFVVTGQPRKQVFIAYIGSSVPVFITTDSLLNGFHVLFEESIYRMELAHARKLPGILERLTKKLDPAHRSFTGDADLLAEARKRSAIFLGTARQLLDAAAQPDDPALRKIVAEETARIIAAKETSKPAWLGPADDGFLTIDYSRFQPRGFYTKSPVLERYFRVVSWLQAIPFRIDRDEELAAMILMRRAFGDDEKQLREVRDVFRSFQEFLGSGDDWDVLAVDAIPKEMTRDSLVEIRKHYREKASSGGAPQVNDQVRFPPTMPGGKVEIGFRFLTASTLPDAVMFQHTTDQKRFQREFPSGLEMCAALGSPWARAQLTKGVPEVVKEIDRHRSLFRRSWHQNTNLYQDYLQCLSILLERTEPDAPKFMRGEAWQSKTCQTALGGWAQMRHTWALHAKQFIRYLSETRQEAGFIEPVPEFYGKFMRHIDRTRRTLKDAGAFDVAESGKERLADFRLAKQILERASKDKKGFESITAEELRTIAKFDPRLNDWDGTFKKGKRLESTLELFQIAAMHCDGTEEGLLEMLEELFGHSANLNHQWESLADVCRELERMAHKQLRGIPWSEREADFVRGYGKTLASIMFYDAHASGHPRDDAPRIVDVFSNLKVGKHLLVGIGKPRDLWVLYPVQGKEILCRGAMLPYYEFADTQRLTDADWQIRLASPERPPQPNWIQPVVAPLESSKKSGN